MALITGDTSGMNEATVQLFAAEDARVMLAARNAARGGGKGAIADGSATIHDITIFEKPDCFRLNWRKP